MSTNNAINDDSDRIYSIRFTPLAYRDMTEAALHLLESTGDNSLAAEWFEGIKAIAATLATNPARFQIQARESRMLQRQTRRLLYKRNATSSAAYHLYFTIDDDFDGPLVKILHIRHASRKPLTSSEAKDIRAGPF